MLRPGRDRRDAAILGMLRNVGIRPSRQRIALVGLLDKSNNPYLTAKILYEKALDARCRVARSTVCNALRQFERAGLLRRIIVHGSKAVWFDHQSVDGQQQG
jgi:Fur family iron response transcriptional regulator